MKEVKLTQGKMALVDDEDFERVNAHRWQARKIGKAFYAGRAKYLGKINGRYKQVNIHMHQFVLGIDSLDCAKLQVDHKNGNGLDNRKENLRIATPSQNRRNLKKLKSNNSSGYRGVNFDKENSVWRARIYTKEGRRKHIGYFSTAEEAARAFDKAAKEIYGEFCGKLNFEDLK